MLGLSIHKLAGVDYGAKLSGNTALCWLPEGNEQLQVSQCPTRKDADTWLTAQLKEQDISCVFIDAPLSLPGVYQQPDRYANFFYRQADQELGAMSPLFLGGLTARAMKLQHDLEMEGIQFVEVYPGGLQRKVVQADHYKQKGPEALKSYLQNLGEHIPYRLPEVINWHQVDALLAWMSGFRYLNEQATRVGDAEEGLIWI